MPPDFSGIITNKPPSGVYAKVYFSLTNLQNQTAELYSDELVLVGNYQGRDVVFSPTFLDTSILEKERGIVAWFEDFPPYVSVLTEAVFDVNPQATNWRLRLQLDSLYGTECTVDIALYDTKLASAVESVASGKSDGVIGVVNRSVVNLRAGPGTNYPIAGQSEQGQKFIINGKNGAGDWYQICCNSGQNAWIAGFLVDVQGDISNVPVITDIPSTPIPTPTPTPLPYNTGIGAPEVQVENWGLRLYDVKKAKTVYYFGTGEFASGVWLIPFLEFRNLGSGTDEPHASLDIYLEDAQGRTFAFDPFNDGVLGASWQFQAGHLYDDINPGSILGIALPFDVTPDLGDVWLRVRQNPNIAIYLGHVSQLAQEN